LSIDIKKELKPMQASKKNSRNPFAGDKNEKEVWEELLKNSRPISKDDFLKNIEKGHKKN
jgi:hypothetical protein